MNDVLKAALGYAARGWFVLPLEPGSKFAGYDFLDRIEFDWMSAAKPETATIRRWFEIEPELNIGIRLRGSGLTVVDIDDMDKWLNTEKESPWPAAPCVRTDRGQHYFFVAEVGDPCGTINSEQGYWGDCLTPYPPEWKPENRSYVVAPPSKHPDGGLYEWIIAPGDGEWTTLPDWVRKQVSEPSPPSSWWADDEDEDRWCCSYCGSENCPGDCIYDYDDEGDYEPEPAPEDFDE